MNDHIDWDDETQAYKVDPEAIEGRQVSMAVVDAVAALANTDPEALDPLWERIDPDALDDIVARGDESPARRVRFRYQGYRVEVTGDREIRLAPTDAKPSAKRQ